MMYGLVNLKKTNSASSFNFHYPVISLKSSRGSLRLLPGLPVTSVFFFSFLQQYVLEGRY